MFAAELCLVPAVVSYVSMLEQPSDSSLGIRTTEWMRDNGARGLVTRIENIYYSLTAPSKGGPPLKALPTQAGAVKAFVARPVHYYRPPNIAPVITPALPGEGVWHATFATGGSRPPVRITSFRPEPSYPQLVAGVAWIDHTRTSVMLYPGLQEPSVAMPSRGPMEVPRQLRSIVVATFNSGFKIERLRRRVRLQRPHIRPLESGPRDDPALPQTGGSMSSPGLGARCAGGRRLRPAEPAPDRVGRQTQPESVRRTVVGRDPRQRHPSAALGRRDRPPRQPDLRRANYQTVGPLAAIMIRAAAVRAMELDINTYWTSFITYRYPGAGDPANLLPTMDRSPERYLTPDDRDFFAVYAR